MLALVLMLVLVLVVVLVVALVLVLLVVLLLVGSTQRWRCHHLKIAPGSVTKHAHSGRRLQSHWPMDVCLPVVGVRG